MSTKSIPLQEAPNWDEVFNDPAVLEVICETPVNTFAYHDAATDDRLLENIRQQAPWLREAMNDALSEQ